MIAGKREETYQFKDDATWFIKPAIAKVEFMTVDFDKDKVEISRISDELVFETRYNNSGAIPIIQAYLQKHQGLIQQEHFEKTSGFNLIKGVTYKINAQVPRVDVNMNVFFTMRTYREWSYGLVNDKYDSLLFDQLVLTQEHDVTVVQV